MRFLSEGRYQLHKVENDARKLMEKHSRSFIIDKIKNEGIMIAPLYEKEKFYEPLACIITSLVFGVLWIDTQIKLRL